MKFMAMMNSINFFKKLGLSMVAVLAISSCVKENMEPMANDSQDLMTISLSTGIQTKTTMTPGVPKLSWTEGDKFDLFSNGGDTKTTPAYTSDDAVIEAGVNQGATEVYAVYPAVEASTKSSVAVTIPAAQTQAVAGKMNGSNVPMYAQGTIEEGAVYLSFKPVAGIFALNIYNTEATEAKVKKVQINPLDAEGNFVYSGYCGTVTTTAEEFSYAPTQEVNGVTLTLGTPCEIASEKPADNAATLNFANQLYIAVARGTYAGLQFIITTDDGKMYVAKTTTARSFEQTDVHYLNINLAGKDEISDDFYGQYNAGLDLTICGNVINKKTHPKSKLITAKMTGNTDLETSLADGGILFLDSSELTADPTMRSAGSSVTLGLDKIIIGRYRNAYQPILRVNSEGAYSFELKGKVMLKNITMSGFRTTRPLFIGASGVTNGTSEFYFEDCTLTAHGGKGIYANSTSSSTVPKSMRFDNCILRADASFFTSGDAKDNTGGSFTTATTLANMKVLENLEFNNCVFAPMASSQPQNAVFDNSVSPLNKNGVLVGLYRKDNQFPNLNISFSYCSFYELGPATSQYGMIFLENLKSLTFDHCLFSNSAWVSNAYLLKLMVKCPTGATYTGTATYSNLNSNNRKLSQGSNSTIGGFDVTMSFTLNSAGTNSVFGTCEPAKHYFPVSEEFVNSLASISRLGASYDTKYWIVPTPAEI